MGVKGYFQDIAQHILYASLFEHRKIVKLQKRRRVCVAHTVSVSGSANRGPMAGKRAPACSTVSVSLMKLLTHNSVRSSRSDLPEDEGMGYQLKKQHAQRTPCKVRFQFSVLKNRETCHFFFILDDGMVALRASAVNPANKSAVR